MLGQNNLIFLENSSNKYTEYMKEKTSTDMWTREIWIVTDDLAFFRSYREIIKIGAFNTHEPLSIDIPADEVEMKAIPAAVIVDLSNWTSESSTTLEKIEKYTEQHQIPLLLRLNLDDLDDTLALISYPQVEYLLSDDPAELLVSLQTNVRKSEALVFQDRDELDITDLKKISADVERIARALTQLSGPETAVGPRPTIANPLTEPYVENAAPSHLSDVPVSFKAQGGDVLEPLGSNQSKGNQAQPTTHPISAKHVRNLIKARRLRDQYFDSELFADPAWDMLLDLMAARLEGQKVSVSSLCIAASVPPTTALRWIKTMTEENIFQRKADEQDGRRIFIDLSDEATAGMIGFFSVIRRNNLMMV